jgi:hypothetical protein
MEPTFAAGRRDHPDFRLAQATPQRISAKTDDVTYSQWLVEQADCEQRQTAG